MHRWIKYYINLKMLSNLKMYITMHSTRDISRVASWKIKLYNPRVGRLPSMPYHAIQSLFCKDILFLFGVTGLNKQIYEFKERHREAGKQMKVHVIERKKNFNKRKTFKWCTRKIQWISNAYMKRKKNHLFRYPSWASKLEPTCLCFQNK